MNQLYLAPATLSQLLADLQSHHDDVALFAGGTDLLVKLHHQPESSGHIVDVKKVNELNELTFDEHGLTIGAAVSCATLAANAQIRQAYPGLIDAADLIGSNQIKNRATLGGNLCNASPAADTVASLIVNRAVCRLASVNGNREVAVEDFVLAPGKTVLQAGELLVNIFLPAPNSKQADAYLRMTPRSEMDIAIAGAAVKIGLGDDGKCRSAEIAIAGVAERVLYVPGAANALIGSDLDDDALTNLQTVVRGVARPITDIRGTQAYRRHIIGVLAKRASLIAYNRLTEGKQ